MSKEETPLHIQPIEAEAMRYLCRSASLPQSHHMVDLSKNYGNGECSCVDFIARRNPAIKAGAELFTRATSCRHLIAVRNHWTVTTLRQIAAMINQNEAKP
jgi:hypothetical protein